MAKRARVFESDGGQMIQLPKELHFEGEEVLISRDGDRVILEPVVSERTWSRRFLDLAGSAPDFPYPKEPPPVETDLDS